MKLVVNLNPLDLTSDHRVVEVQQGAFCYEFDARVVRAAYLMRSKGLSSLECTRVLRSLTALSLLEASLVSKAANTLAKCEG